MSNLLITEGLGASDVPFVVDTITPAPFSVTLVFASPVTRTGDSLNPTKWYIVNGPGAAPVTVQSVVFDGTSTITINTTEHKNGGAYTLHIPQGLVDDLGRPFVGPFDRDYTGVGDLPFIVNAIGVDERALDVVFSEPVNVADAETPGNYTIVGPGNVVVVGAKKVTDNTFRLATTPMERVTTYTVEVENIRDLADNVIDSSHP